MKREEIGVGSERGSQKAKESGNAEAQRRKGAQRDGE